MPETHAQIIFCNESAECRALVAVVYKSATQAARPILVAQESKKNCGITFYTAVTYYFPIALQIRHDWLNPGFIHVLNCICTPRVRA